VAIDPVQVLFVGRRGKDAVTYDSAAVLARFGVPPERLPSYVALVGDPSDNLPSVPGIGPRSAATLLASVRSCADLYEHLAEVKSARLRAALEEHREQVLLTERLARLRDDLPLPEGPRCRAPSAEQLTAVRSWFEAHEMKSLLPRVSALI
jgi:DNA polymerase I